MTSITTLKPVNAIAVKFALETFADVVSIEKIETTKNGLLKSAYKNIGCDCVDIVRVTMLGHVLSIWVDDNGRINSQNDSVRGFVIRTDSGDVIPLAGNIFITGDADENGETMTSPLTRIEVQQLLEADPKDHKYIGPFIAPANIPTL